MTEAGKREEAFRSAMERLPMAVVIVDGQHRLQAYNRRAVELFETESLNGDLLQQRPQHPLSRLIAEIRLSNEPPHETVLSFPSGRCYRVEPSRRSEKGMDRWLMLLLSAATPTPAAHDFDFTPREREVAELLMSGANSDTICDTLSITNDTLKSHLSRLFEKTATRTRAALVAKLLAR